MKKGAEEAAGGGRRRRKLWVVVVVRTEVWAEPNGGEQWEWRCEQRCERRYLIACINLLLALDIGVSFLICFVELDSVKFIAGHYPILETRDSTWWQCEKNIELQIERGGTSKTLTLLVRFFILGYLLLSIDNLVEYDLTYGFRGWRWWLFEWRNMSGMFIMFLIFMMLYFSFILLIHVSLYAYLH